MINKQLTRLTSILLPILILACGHVSAKDLSLTTTKKYGYLDNHDAIIKYLANTFTPLPEKQLGISQDKTIYTQYADPTSRYEHAILGDAIEAATLVLIKDKTVYTLTLTEDYVFEDIKPRLFDVDGDGELEVITIRSHVDDGAGIMIYKIMNSKLTEYAWVDDIGLGYRWLNIAAIYDLDSDGNVELAWIQTPHIGGILKVAQIQPGRLQVIDEEAYFSNHTIGETNLCLSVLTKTSKAPTLYVPTQNGNMIVGFQFKNDKWEKTKVIKQKVRFSKSLHSQYTFRNIIQGDNHCNHP